MDNNNLPKDFVTFEKALELIKSDRRDNPVVDTRFLVNNIPYIREHGNYNIKLVKYDKNGKVVEAGHRYVYIADEYQAVALKKAIVDHYAEVSKKHTRLDYNQIGVSSVTNTIDEDKNPSGKAIPNSEPLTKFDDPTTGGYREVGA